MNKYGIINQDNKLVVYDQAKHKQIFKCTDFSTLSEWVQHHPAKYEFINLEVTITADNINYL